MENLKILVVEDDLISQRIVQLMLEHLGYQVDIAQNGEEVFKLFLSGHYKLIFMDIGLPDQLGTEITRLLRKIEQAQNSYPTPIIALTAHGDYARAECLAVGMDDFLGKPLMMEELAIVLAKWIVRSK